MPAPSRAVPGPRAERDRIRIARRPAAGRRSWSAQDLSRRVPKRSRQLHGVVGLHEERPAVHARPTPGVCVAPRLRERDVRQAGPDGDARRADPGDRGRGAGRGPYDRAVLAARDRRKPRCDGPPCRRRGDGIDGGPPGRTGGQGLKHRGAALRSRGQDRLDASTPRRLGARSPAAPPSHVGQLCCRRVVSCRSPGPCDRRLPTPTSGSMHGSSECAIQRPTRCATRRCVWPAARTSPADAR